MTKDVLVDVTKDDLVLAMLAVLGGETSDINERDLFLACWHAFPATMRWVDTALPNPDTFTASLRRLDQRGYITRRGKQKRRPKRSRSRRKTLADAAGKSTVVKARIAEGGLEAAGVDSDVITAVRQLRPNPDAASTLTDPRAIAICIGLRERAGRGVDEGALVELAFHRFPDRFAYSERPEFPDVERIRSAIGAARQEGLIDNGLRLSTQGQGLFEGSEIGEARVDASQAPAVGELRFAARIENNPAYLAYVQNGTLATTKPDELYRALRIPPTADPQPIADALRTRVRALRRIDKAEVADFLIAIAARHNPDVFALVDQVEMDGVNSNQGGGA